LKVIVFGGSGGIGSALIRRLVSRYPDAELFATSHKAQVANEPNVVWESVDLCSGASISAYASNFKEVHWIINAVGMLHQGSRMPEKTVRTIDPDFFMSNVQLNALATLLIAKHFKAALSSASEMAGITRQFATVSAKVGSIEDNRLGGWYSYRCSKAALNMAIKNLSIEWRRTLPSVCVTSLHPGTTETDLSAPFQRNVPEGKLFSPDTTAEYLISRLSQLTPKDSGKFLTYDGEVLPW